MDIYHRIISDLQIIASLQAGQTLSTSTDPICIVDHRSWSSTLWRRYSHENRHKSIEHIKFVISNGLDLLTAPLARGNKLLLVQAIERSLVGVGNLKTTYRDDADATIKIAELITSSHQILRLFDNMAANNLEAGNNLKSGNNLESGNLLEYLQVGNLQAGIPNDNNFKEEISNNDNEEISNNDNSNSEITDEVRTSMDYAEYLDSCTDTRASRVSSIFRNSQEIPLTNNITTQSVYNTISVQTSYNNISEQGSTGSVVINPTPEDSVTITVDDPQRLMKIGSGSPRYTYTSYSPRYTYTSNSEAQTVTIDSHVTEEIIPSKSENAEEIEVEDKFRPRVEPMEVTIAQIEIETLETPKPQPDLIDLSSLVTLPNSLSILPNSLPNSLPNPHEGIGENKKEFGKLSDAVAISRIPANNLSSDSSTSSSSSTTSSTSSDSSISSASTVTSKNTENYENWEQSLNSELAPEIIKKTFFENGNDYDITENDKEFHRSKSDDFDKNHRHEKFSDINTNSLPESNILSSISVKSENLSKSPKSKSILRSSADMIDLPIIVKLAKSFKIWADKMSDKD